jgi:hypothetical protein
VTRPRPRIDRRPLLDTAGDAELFVDRQDQLARLERAVTLRLNAVVTGPAGAGATSLLRHLTWQLRTGGGQSTTVLQVSAADAEDATEVLRRLLRRAAGDEAEAAAIVARSDAVAVLERLAATLPDDAVLLLDDVSAAVGRGLFGALRDDLWRLPVSWLVGVSATDAEVLLRPPADVFFEVVVELPPLSGEDARELLRRRGVDVQLADADALTALTDGVPRRLVDVGRTLLLEGRTVGDLLAERSGRQERVEGLSEPASALLRVLEDVGPAGPSDSSVQERMAVSRPRLVTLFRELLDAGLVAELGPGRETGSPKGPGRPRLRYRPIGSAPFGNVGGSRDGVTDET